GGRQAGVEVKLLAQRCLLDRVGIVLRERDRLRPAVLGLEVGERHGGSRLDVDGGRRFRGVAGRGKRGARRRRGGNSQHKAKDNGAHGAVPPEIPGYWRLFLLIISKTEDYYLRREAIESKSKLSSCGQRIGSVTVKMEPAESLNSLENYP